MKEANSESIITFTLGILSIIVPYIGLIIGIIGLVLGRKVIRENGKGNTLAVSGKVLSIVGICIQSLLFLLALLGFLMFYFVDTNEELIGLVRT